MLRLVNEPRETSIHELIDILEKLKIEGININEIQQYKQTEGTRNFITLKDTVSEEILKKYNWNRDYKIGTKISMAKEAYKGRGGCILTDEDRSKLEQLGLKITSKSTISSLIDVLEILKQEEIDVSKIKQSITTKGKVRSTTLADIIEEDKIKQHGLDGNYNIGRAINQAKSAYKGSGTCIITEDERLKLEELGIIDELSKKEAEQQKLIAKRDAAKQLYSGAKIALSKQEKSEQENV